MSWPLRVFFTENVFAPENLTLRDALAVDTELRKVLVVIEDALLARGGPRSKKKSKRYFTAATRNIIATGPRADAGRRRRKQSKNSIPLVTEILSAYRVAAINIDRHSYVIARRRRSAAGRGRICRSHRGTPTACGMCASRRRPLAQADSGIGVKNAINGFGKKNFIGTFAPPYAVINDFDLLATLAPRVLQTRRLCGSG